MLLSQANHMMSGNGSVRGLAMLLGLGNQRVRTALQLLVCLLMFEETIQCDLVHSMGMRHSRSPYVIPVFAARRTMSFASTAKLPA